MLCAHRPISAWASSKPCAHVIIVKGASRHFGRPLHSILLFDPRRELLPPRPHISFAVARSGGHGASSDDKGVPNLFLTSGAEQFNNPSEFPWIVPFYPTFVSQGRLFAKFILHERASAKIAVQYENDDIGRDYLKGLKQGLGAMASQMIVRELSHELSDPTVNSQILDFKATGADTLNSAVHAVEVCRTGNQGSVRPELASAAHRCFDRRLGRIDVYSGRCRGLEGRDNGVLGTKSRGSIASRSSGGKRVYSLRFPLHATSGF